MGKFGSEQLRTAGPFADLHVAHFGAVDDETQRRADFVDAVISRSARVEMEQLVDRIVDDRRMWE